MKANLLKFFLLFQLLLTNCNEVDKKNLFPILSYISRFRIDSLFSTLPTPIPAPVPVTPSPVTISNYTNNFYSSETLAPILIPKDKVLEFNFGVEISTCEIFLGTTKQNFTIESNSSVTKFTPSSAGWTLGVETAQALTFQNCVSKSGTAIITSNPNINLYVAEKVIYVDSVLGVDTNLGTTEAPMKTILASLTSASTGCLDRCAIGIKGGEYLISGSITMPLNTSIFGGFHSTDWTKRRADKTMLSPYDSILKDTSVNIPSASATITSPYSTLKFVSYVGLQNKSIIDGVVVNGPVSATATSFVAPIGSVNLQSGAGFILRNSICNDLSDSNNVTSSGFSSVSNFGTILIDNSILKASTTSVSISTRYGVRYNIFHLGSAITISNSNLDSSISSASGSGFFSEGGTKAGMITLTKNTIKGPVSSLVNSIGITADFSTSGAMSITENTITSAIGTDSYGINAVDGSGLIISKNSITSGNGSTSSKGISTNSSTSNFSITDNTITSGSGGTNGSTAVILFQSTGTHTISNNVLTGGSCVASNCISSAIETNNPMDTIITNNQLSSGACTGATCTTSGIYLNSAGTHTISGNTINSTGSCTTASCIATGIFNASAGIITLNSTGNTISSGTCSGNNCTTSGFFSNANSASGSGFNFTNNNITSGNCTGATCNANGIASNTTTSATFNFDNNTISSGTGVNTWGANILFASTSIFTNNNINVGTATTAQTGFRFAGASSLTMNGNTIRSGTLGVNRTAFRREHPSGGPTDIQRNTFINESNGTGTPIAVDLAPNSNPNYRFCSNLIVGGGRTNPGNASGLQLGVLNGGAIIMGNTIIGPTIVSGGIASLVNFNGISGYTGLRIDQNILFGNGPLTNCINETPATNYNGTLAKNSFTACSSVFYRRGPDSHDTFCSGNFGRGGCPGSGLLSNPTGNGNLINTPMFTNLAGNNFRLDASTHTNILNGADESAFNTACGNSLDRDGNTRTAGTAIGAYR